MALAHDKALHTRESAGEHQGGQLGDGGEPPECGVPKTSPQNTQGSPASCSRMRAYADGLNHGATVDASDCPGCVSWFSTKSAARAARRAA